MRRIVLATSLMLALSIPLMVFGSPPPPAPDAGDGPAALGATVVGAAVERGTSRGVIQGVVAPHQPSGTAPGTALVVIGDTRHEFDVTGLCTTNPSTHVLGVARDGSTLLADFPVIGPITTHGDPASIVVHQAGGGSWVADSATAFDVATGSVVHSWEVDDRTVVGTAAFSRVRSTLGEVVPVEPGTFAIACG